MGKGCSTHDKANLPPPPNHSLYQLFITLGILLANIINYPTSTLPTTASWRIPMGIGFLPALLLGTSILLVFPESPVYAYRRGDIATATITMTKFLGVSSQFHPTIVFELEQLRRKVESETAGGPSRWHEALTGPKMLRRTLLGIVMMAFQQLSGANFFFYYGTTLFSITGFESPFLTQIILASVYLICTFPGLYFVSAYSRRKCLIFGGLFMSACFLVFASVGHFALNPGEPEGEGQPGTENERKSSDKAAGTVMIVFASLFLAAFASTWGPMVWSSVAELYPSRYRATCIGLAAASNWIFAFFIAFCTPFIISDIDYLYGYVFAGCCAAASATVYFFLIEPKGRGLEELDTMYLAGVRPWESAKWVAPLKGNLQEKKENPGVEEESAGTPEERPTAGGTYEKDDRTGNV